MNHLTYGDSEAIEYEYIDDEDYSGSDVLSDFDEFGDEDEVGSRRDSDEGDAFNEDMENFHLHLRAAQGFRKAKAKGGRRRAADEASYTHEVRALISEANQRYVQNKLQEAQALVEQIIRIDGSVFPAWKMLGEIHKERGDEKKCFMSWFTAAHCRPKDYQLWLECARMSVDLEGPNETAVYCYNRALRANPNDISIMYDKASLHRQLGQFNKAADGFLGLLKALPHDMSVLKEIAQVFIQLQRASDAIQLYEEGINYYQGSGLSTQDGFGWSDLNILAELYMLRKEWGKALSKTKSLGRWLWGRQDEVYWDQIQGDDREWDEFDNSRKCSVKEYIPGKYPDTSYIMPIELRVKLGVCRLKLGNLEEATLHFKSLRDHELDSNIYADLFQEAGDALVEFGSYELALDYYGVVAASQTSEDSKLWFSMARCYKEVGSVGDAEECYNTILNLYPDDIDARMQLAEIYEVSDRREAALQLVNEIIELRKRQEASTNGTNQPRESSTFFAPLPTSAISSYQRRRAITAAERAEMDRQKKEQTLAKYRKLEYLRPQVEKGDISAVREWLDTAGELADDFRNTKVFFPSERSVRFKGFATTAMRRAEKRGTDANMRRMQHRLQEALAFHEEDISTTEDLTQFRGIDFDDWLYIFMQYAICLTKFEDPQDAYDVIKVAKEANVFYHSERRKYIVYCTHLACAICAKDAEVASDVTRYFTHSYQFQGEAYKLFSAAMLVCGSGQDVFHYGANQKYFLRQIKAMDKVLTGRTNIIGAASLTGRTDGGGAYLPKEFDLTLLMLYGHMVAAGRSYIPALNYFARAYAIAPDHPMVNLSIGISYLHRAMQRQSDNRHWEILEGMTFLFRYYGLRNLIPGYYHESQEAEYNIGRAFHQLGLTHLAIQYYEKVLAISDEQMSTNTSSEQFDFRFEAAYNLQAIYVSSGNPELARRITEKYLVM